MGATPDPIAATAASEIWTCHLGLVPYEKGLHIQHTLRERRRAGELPDMLLLLEHPAIYTLGRRTKAAEELPFDETFYRVRGIELFASDRGGRVTYHAPGQLVGYPIMAVSDVVRHVRTMEQAIADALGELEIAARARPEDGPDYTGVWVEQRKIASIGVHVAHGVTTHGFAVNVTNDLEPFSWVVACGLADVSMTSIARETARPERLACFRKRMAYSFARTHGARQRLVSAQRLGIETTEPIPIPKFEVLPA